jgi:hypothetical protein
MKLEYEREKSSPKFRAKIYRDGHLFANGAATVSKDEVIFYPNNPKSLAIALNDKIKMKVKKTQPLVALKLSEELRDASSDRIWFFEIGK